MKSDGTEGIGLSEGLFKQVWDLNCSKTKRKGTQQNRTAERLQFPSALQ